MGMIRMALGLALGVLVSLSARASWAPQASDWQVVVEAETGQGLDLRILPAAGVDSGAGPSPALPEESPLAVGGWIALPDDMDPVAGQPELRWSDGRPHDARWSLGRPVLWLGQRYASISVNPLADNGAVLESFTLHVDFSSAHATNPGHGRGLRSRLQMERAAQRSINPGLVERSALSRQGELPLGRYLVVGKSAALGYLGDWLDWRRSQGYVVTTMSTESLGATGTNWEPIQEAASSLFEDEGLDYLLLVGDMNFNGGEYHVPGDLVPGGQYAEPAWGRNIVSDHSLALLEGDDYFSDILVGRLPADNAAQLAVMLNRLVIYDRQPTITGSQWLRQATMIFDVSGAGSRRETSMAIRQHLLESGFTAVDTIRNDRYQNPLPPAVVTNSLNEGRAFVNYRGFGYREKWNGPQFGVDQMDDLSNYGQWPLVTSLVCGGGDFANTNYDPCLGEGFLRAGSSSEPTGAVAFFGPSEEDTHSQWNNCIDLGIYQGLLHEDIREMGALLERGKAELWHCFPNDREGVWYDPGSTSQATNVRFYHYCYNLLGDPGTRARLGIPRELSAEFIPPAQGATRVEVELVDGAGQPVADAWVSLTGQGDQLVALGRTGADGRVELATSPLEDEPLRLVAHGDDLIPWEMEFTPAPALRALDLQGWSFLPNSSLLAAGDTLHVSLELAAIGQLDVPQGWRLDLAVEGDALAILRGSQLLPTIAAGTTHLADSLAVVVTGSVEAGQRLEFILTLTDGDLQAQWTRACGQAAGGAQPVLAALAADPARPVAGGSCELTVSFTNEGQRPLDAVRATLYPVSEALSVVDGEVELEPVDVGAAGEAGPFEVLVADGVLDGAEPGLELVFFRADGSTAARLPFTLAIGTLSATDPTGPDDHGYVIFHDEDAGELAPDYAYINIASSGTEVILNDEGVAFNEEGIDGASTVVRLPFTFRFYGQDYDSLTINSNGWLAMGDQRDHILGLNTPIPAAQGPNGMIAVFWADLYNYWNGSRFGRCYMEYDEERHLFIVQWNNFQHTGHPYQDNWFQAVLRDPAHWPTPTGDGEILLQYQDIVTNLGDHFFTVGIERPDQMAGLQYVFNNEYAGSAQAISAQTALLVTTARVFGETGVEPQARPERLALSAASPNPFNPSTTLRVQVAQAGRLTVDAYNVRGERVRRVLDQVVPAGEQALRFDGTGLAGGVYLLEARQGDARAVRRVCYLP